MCVGVWVGGWVSVRGCACMCAWSRLNEHDPQKMGDDEVMLNVLGCQLAY